MVKFWLTGGSFEEGILGLEGHRDKWQRWLINTSILILIIERPLQAYNEHVHVRLVVNILGDCTTTPKLWPDPGFAWHTVGPQSGAPFFWSAEWRALAMGNKGSKKSLSAYLVLSKWWPLGGSLKNELSLNNKKDPPHPFTVTAFTICDSKKHQKILKDIKSIQQQWSLIIDILKLSLLAFFFWDLGCHFA